METIYTVTCSSNVFIKHTAVMFFSLLTNIKQDTKVVIHIIGNIEDENKTKFNKVVKEFNTEVYYLPVDEEFFKDFKVTHHFSKETYYRIIAPDLLGKDIQKALLLDGDIIVTQDIHELWSTDINNYHLAAVEGGGAKYARHKELNIPSSSRYFNAGVMLMNLSKLREDNISRKVIQFIQDNPSKIKWLDQDGLNAILHDKWLELDPKWNYQTPHLKQLTIEPAVIHYTGKHKPWHNRHGLKEEYFKYLRMISW